MKANKSGFIDLMHFPIEETTAVIEAMKKAEQAGDLPALKWCARRVIQLFDLFEDDPCGSDEPYIPVKVFNEIWETELRHDPAPESIAAVINPPIAPKPPRRNVDIDYTDADIHIGDRGEALALIDEMLEAVTITHSDVALEALKDAIAREVI